MLRLILNPQCPSLNGGERELGCEGGLTISELLNKVKGYSNLGAMVSKECKGISFIIKMVGGP